MAIQKALQAPLLALALAAAGLSAADNASAQTGSYFHGHSALPAATARPVGVATASPATVGARVDVTLDRTGVVRLPASAAAVVVGNPDIADIAVHSTDTLLVLGRSYGRTNILAMDAAGRIIADTAVHVGAGSHHSRLRVYEGSKSRRTFACEPDCLPAPELGDDAGFLGQFRPAAPQLSDQMVSQGASGAPLPSMMGVPSGFPAPAPAGAPPGFVPSSASMSAPSDESGLPPGFPPGATMSAPPMEDFPRR